MSLNFDFALCDRRISQTLVGLMDARSVFAPIRSPQWMTACAPAACACFTAAASGSARSWLSETMQIFMMCGRDLGTPGIGRYGKI